MNLGKTSLGLIVVFIGVFILLDNLDILHFDWLAVVYFWPLLVILSGINILLPKKMEGQILSIMATVIVLIFFAYQGMKTSEIKWNLTEERDITESNQLSQFSRDYDEKVPYAELNISGGVIGYKISETSNKLIDIEASSSLSSFALSSILTDGKAILDFTQKEAEGTKQKRLKTENNEAVIRLNSMPIWDINLKVGVGSADFDLKSFKIRNLEIDGGVSTIKIAVGIPAEKVSKIDFEGGMSSLDIRLPEQVACIIHVESALSSLKFPGFVKQEDGTYLSDNYNESLKRVEIRLKNGLSSIKVIRYK